MSTVFPTGIDTYATLVDRGIIYHTTLNNIQDALVAVETYTRVPGALFPTSAEFGATGDGQYVADGVAVSGDATFTSATAAFTSADVGKIIVIEGADTTAYPHVTTIASYTSATSVELTAAPTRSQTSAATKWGTDDSNAIQAAITAARAAGVPLIFPPAIYMLTEQLVMASNDVWIGTPGRSILCAGAAFAGAMLTDNGSVIAHGTLYGLTVDGAGLAYGCVDFPFGMSYASTPYLNPYQVIGGEIAFCNFIGWTDTAVEIGAHSGAKLYMHDVRIRGFIGPTGAVVADVGLIIDQSDGWYENIYVNAFTEHGIIDKSGTNWWRGLHIDGGTGTGIRFENAAHYLSDSEIDMSNNAAAPTYAIELAGSGRYYIHNNVLRAGEYAGSSIVYVQDDTASQTKLEMYSNECSRHSGTGAVATLIGGDNGAVITQARVQDNHNLSSTITSFVELAAGGTITITGGVAVPSAPTKTIYAATIGVGTTSPGRLLAVEAATGAVIQVKDTTTPVTVELQAGDAVASLVAVTNHPVTLATNNTERMRVDAAGNVIVNTAAILTTATDGFLYVPTCAGTPTGVPTTYTGRAALVYDSTNNKLYIYDSGWLDMT
jgi:hypothetical protein